MRQIIPYILIWLGCWCLYFSANDFHPSSLQFPTLDTTQAQPLAFAAANAVIESSGWPQSQSLLQIQGHLLLFQQLDWRTWFLGSGASMLCIAFILVTRNKEVRHFQDKMMLDRIRDLEQVALRTKMNPHFIFNALNAIQGYILTGDKRSSAVYLSKFSALIRQTLDYSDVNAAPLKEELRMLRGYMDLEKLRFENRFDYKIEVDESLSLDHTFIPTMLIQPFVENAILHGLGPKEGKGFIQICIASVEDGITVRVVDDGIGIETSKRKKQEKQYQHRSMGLNLTQKRLALLRKDRDQLSLRISELKDAGGRARGTAVNILIARTEEKKKAGIFTENAATCMGFRAK